MTGEQNTLTSNREEKVKFVVLDDLAPHELVGQHEAAVLHHHLQRTKSESA